MGNRKISDDAKVISLRLRERGLDSCREILKIVGFSQATYYHTICRKEATGSVAKAKVLGRGRPRRLLHSDSQYILSDSLTINPHYFLMNTQIAFADIASSPFPWQQFIVRSNMQGSV